MKKSQACRFVAFLIVFLTLFSFFNRIFKIEISPGFKRFVSFYNSKENSIDGVYVGASSVDRYWHSVVAWRDYGMTVHSLSSNAQPTVLQKYVIEEARKTQPNAFFIVDLRQARKSPTFGTTDATIRQVTDNMPFSKNKVKAINAALKAGEIDNSPIEYYLDIIKYHSRWETGIERDDFYNIIDKNKGTYLEFRSYFTVKMKKPVYTDESEPIDSDMEKIVRDLMQYGKREKLKILYVISPLAVTEEEMKSYNYLAKVAEDEGVDFIDFNRYYDEIGIDFSKDFYNRQHVNVYGGEKFTKYLAKILKEKFNPSDKRYDIENYGDWNEAYASYISTNYSKKNKQVLGMYDSEYLAENEE